MTKTIRRMLSLVMVLAICMSVAVAASASSDSRTAGIYGFISGDCAQDETRVHALHTTTRVTRNPDAAQLKTEVEFYNGETLLTTSRAYSDAQAKTFSYEFPILINVQGTPDTAYVNHHVMRISDDDEFILYSAFTYTSIEFESIGEWEQ